MTPERFGGSRRLSARALLVGHYVNLRAVEPSTRLAGAPLVVADALAKSAVLEHYETAVAAVFDEVEPLAEALSGGRRDRIRGEALVRHVGRTLDIQQRMVGRVEVEEKPEALWERPDLERLHQRLAEEYELRERHGALERKLELIVLEILITVGQPLFLR